MPEKKQPALVLTLQPDSILRLTTLLQRGFLVPCKEPVSLYDFLLELPGFDHTYITDSIETIFINGCAADSLQRRIVPGNTVALSAAMPGLAGAIFRKGGAHASLRSKPVHAPDPQAVTEGFITVKLFNMVATDKGEGLLTRGIVVKGSTLSRFFNRQQERLHSLTVDIRQGTDTLSMEETIQLAATHPRILLKVENSL